jgi:hypothetical protein
MSVTFGPRRGFMINAVTGDAHDIAFRALLRGIDAMLLGAVINFTTSAPPGSPANGDAYIVKATGTGAWAGHDNAIAIWTTDNPGGSAWEFYAPTAGMLVWNVGTLSFYAYDGSAWGVLSAGALPVTVNARVASYTAALGDANNIVTMNVAGANSFTVPPHSVVAFGVGVALTVTQLGAGQTTLVAGAGVTLLTPATLGLRAQNSTAALIQIAVDTWLVAGDLQ